MLRVSPLIVGYCCSRAKQFELKTRVKKQQIRIKNVKIFASLFTDLTQIH